MVVALSSCLQLVLKTPSQPHLLPPRLLVYVLIKAHCAIHYNVQHTLLEKGPVFLPQGVTLERGIEEEASEIYVKQEIPFSISLVSSLLDDIRCNLVGQSETIGGHTHLCPDLEVTKLDDVTSCLTVLRDYITAWSCDVTKNSHSLREEVRQARVQMADMEMQLQETMKESEGVENSLLNQLQVYFVLYGSIFAERNDTVLNNFGTVFLNSFVVKPHTLKMSFIHRRPLF